MRVIRTSAIHKPIRYIHTLGQTDTTTTTTPTVYDTTATLFKTWFPTIALVGVTAFMVVAVWSLSKRFK